MSAANSIRHFAHSAASHSALILPGCPDYDHLYASKDSVDVLKERFHEQETEEKEKTTS
jgi:hypothetical protein